MSDIFWTFTSSAWNTSFKLLFLGSSAYTVYLMLYDLKPTHDPGLDTFKVEYLLGGSAVLAILFPYEYKLAEVGKVADVGAPEMIAHRGTDTVGVFNLARVCRHSPPALHAPADRRSGDHNNPLPLCPWHIPSSVHPELAVPLLRRRSCRSDRLAGRDIADDLVLRFLLHLLHQVSTSCAQSTSVKVL